MRRFECEDFSYDLAEGLESFHLTVPDGEAEDALSYVRQFVYKTRGSSELHRGYISESYLDALVRVREASTNCRGFSSAVEALGVAGEVSEEVTGYEELVFVEVENSFDSESALTEIVRGSSVSDESRRCLYSIRDLVMDNRGSVVYYLPREVAGEIMLLLDGEGILL